MSKEIQTAVIYAERQSKSKFDGDTSANESIILLGNLGYHKVKVLDPAGEEDRDKIGFISEIKKGYSYPRFHIILERSTFEIIRFHIDERRHKSLINFSKKNDETKNLIRELEKKEQSAARDSLLLLFRYELLCGNIREMNTLEGVTQEARLKWLIMNSKGDQLKRRRKHTLNERKNNEKWLRD